MNLKDDELKKIDQYIEKNKAQIIADLRKVVEIPSVAGDAEGDAPYGAECLEILRESLRLFQNAGYSGRLAKSNKYAVMEYGKGNKTIGIFAHGDVVEAEGEWLYGEPFKLTERDGYLIGRGCCDDKCGIIEMLYAVKIIDAIKLPLEHKIIFYVGGNEESGMHDLEDFIKNEPMPDISLVIDGEYPYYKSEKSRLCLMLENMKSFENIKNISGGEVANVVLDRLDVEYKNGKTEAIKGIAGHAAYPEDTENALVKFAKNAEDNENLTDTDKRILREAYGILADYNGRGLGIADFNNGFKALTAANGVVRTNDGHLSVSLDIRCGLVDKEDIINAIIKKTNGAWKVNETFYSEGYVTNDKSPEALAIKGVYSTLFGAYDGIETGGATYARQLKNAFCIATDIRYQNEERYFPEGHGNIHGPDEAMTVKGFLDAIKALTLMIIELDKTL